MFMAPKVALRIALMPTRKEGREGCQRESERGERRVKSAQRALKRILPAKWSGQRQGDSGATPRDLSGVTDANPTLGNWLRAVL